MFRDFKEYQEITKLYTEKVSKPEKLEENRNTRGSELAAKRLADKPKTREEVGLKPIEKKPFVGSRSRFMNKKTEVKKEPEYKPVKGVVFGQRTNEVGALGGGKPSSVPVEKSKPEVSTMTKQGKPRTKAQMMAAKRIADGKSIADVKAANTASMKAKASERNQKFQDAKKSGNLAQFRKDNPKVSGADRAKQMAKDRLAKKAAMEEFTPYDIVLEYLLSTKQVATIEEANYVMTEMDSETIQDIVEMDRAGGIGALTAIGTAGAFLAKPAINAVTNTAKMLQGIKKKKEDAMNPKK